MDQSGDVISHLNISSAGTEDGGLYACVASNTLATVEHKARLNIYGTSECARGKMIVARETRKFAYFAFHIKCANAIARLLKIKAMVRG